MRGPIAILSLLLSLPVAGPCGDFVHRGFYLGFGYGGGGSVLETEYTATDLSVTVPTAGTGMAVDARIGTALRDDLILHGTVIQHIVPGPTTRSGSVSETPLNEMDFQLLGAGVTRYFMPANLFLSGSLGLATVSGYADTGESGRIGNNGFGFQIKAGKEWRLNTTWGLGVAFDFVWARIGADSHRETDSYGRVLDVEETDTYRHVGVQLTAALH